MRRTAARLWMVIVVVTLATALSLPSTAHANAYYPSTCHHWAYGSGSSGWDANCWLGENGSKYINRAAYVQGMQIILKGFGYYTLSIDGIFGNGTYTGVRLYQQHEGIGSDGIVGNMTWHRLRGELYFTFYQCSSSCWWTYSSPGTIGVNRWHMGDYRDANGHLYPWSYVWSGFGVLFGTNGAV